MIPGKFCPSAKEFLPTLVKEGVTLLIITRGKSNAKIDDWCYSICFYSTSIFPCHSEPAQTISPSTGCLLLLSCG